MKQIPLFYQSSPRHVFKPFTSTIFNGACAVLEEGLVSSEWIESVKSLLKELGARFEAEESVRIHIGGAVAEVMEREGGFAVSISIEVPKTIALGEVDRHADAYREMLRLIAKAGLEPGYELDTSIGYAFLRAVLTVKDLEELLSILKKMLS
jgi:hypothetical protein